MVLSFVSSWFEARRTAKKPFIEAGSSSVSYELSDLVSLFNESELCAADARHSVLKVSAQDDTHAGRLGRRAELENWIVRDGIGHLGQQQCDSSASTLLKNKRLAACP
ncbi:hypothetical protein [Bradyrhizobium sp. CCGUVB23]|uniref:hypothetical protein n=1 Tax=Bradyrhizobium sp. CCGUVB23 TaxID=2949630 RepID=UPI0020B276B5|nr:hypothetical protein [Bradyrhizobium sp. CCGUVB23]MCP3460992.1 hypothetical protein [Bradyrhizobium sp. CCGUVB23]